ncbi:hypothetical protein [Changpingibacter yushuensis]|uniref:hypothetical protein n=1 Tax=Changpingibacter yushuensis TaxID=2758440 RepID=UPI0015F3B31C|nr:hypothetical protein [Changpingibacter yushuensis]
MAFLDLLRQLLKHTEESAQATAQRAEGLRAQLQADPNDVEAFEELAQLVRDMDRQSEPVDPLTADTSSRIPITADLALWALAEEIGASPHAWYPLVELARLSVDSDREGALRRVSVAADRDPTGKALAAGIRVLRDADLPHDALNLGLGRWRPGTQVFEAGEQVVRAAIESGHVAEASAYLSELTLEGHEGEVASLEEAIRSAKEN